jgi:hypothetical protein
VKSSNRYSAALRITLAAGLLLALTTMATVANAGVLPLNSRAFGKSYGEWTAAFWQWVLNIPEANNPLLDDTGEFAGVGQSGPVFFLAGSFGESEERTLTIPAGKAIFIPAHVWIFGALANDCEPSVPGVTCDVPTLRAAAAAAANGATVLQVSVDGKEIADVHNYRAASPEAFDVTLPEGNVLGFPAGTYGPHVADGYSIMLTPLTPGQHTIVVHAVNPGASIDYTMTFHITVSR